MGFWCMTPCGQMDSCLLFEDNTLVTVMKIQGVITEVTIKHRT